MATPLSFAASACPRGLVQASPCASRLHDNAGAMPVTLENWYVPGVPVDVGIVGSLGMAFDQTHRGRFAYDPSVDKVKSTGRNGQ